MNSIPDILAKLQRAECTGGQALEWIEMHVARAGDAAADRDKLAATAMGAFCASASGLGAASDAEIATVFAKVAHFSYIMADAMLAARGSK